MDNGEDLEIRLLPITIGVSGHIDILKADIDPAGEHFLNLISRFSFSFPNTPIQLLVSLAVGSDRIAARIFTNLREKLMRTNPEIAKRWELIVVLPLPEDEFKKDFPDSVDEFDMLIKQSDFVVTMPIKNGMTPTDISSDGEKRNRQYQDATRYISSHANILVAFWDGNDPKKMGGTHDAIRMRLFTHSTDDKFDYSLLATDQTQFVHHIKVNRGSALVDYSIETRFEGSINFSNSIDRTVKNFKDAFKLEKYNELSLKKLQKRDFNQSLNNLFSAEIIKQIRGNLQDYSLKSLIELYATSDSLAIKNEKEWRFYTNFIYLLGFITSLLLPVAVEDIFLPWSMIGYMVLLSLSFLFYSLIRIRKIEDRHVESRVLAEFFRIQIVWLFNGNSSQNEFRKNQNLISYFPEKVSSAFLGQQLISLDWIGRVLTSSIIYLKELPADEKGYRHENIILDWVLRQKTYLKKSRHKSEAIIFRFNFLSKLLVIGGLFSALSVIFMSLHHIHDEALHRTLIVLAAALPIMSVVLENYLDNLGYEMRAKTNERLLSVFENAFNQINNGDVDQHIRRLLVSEVGKEAVSEAMAWYFLRRSKSTKISL